MTTAAKEHLGPITVPEHVRGQALIKDIDAYQTKPGELALWWFGQHSFVLKVAGKTIYLDPFLSAFDGRRVPPLVKAEEVKHADFICGTHDHEDHIDRGVWPALAASSPQAKFVVPNLLREGISRDLKIPATRLIGMDDGKSTTVDGVKISAIPAAHEFLNRDAATGQYPFLGYIVEAGGFAVYHAGDTCIYEGMQDRLRKWKLDVMLLPINGRDAWRFTHGIIGNMTYQEAVDLAGVLEPRYAIPTHYEMFAANAANPQDFVEYARVKYPRLQTHVCTHGERFIIKKS